MLRILPIAEAMELCKEIPIVYATLSDYLADGVGEVEMGVNKDGVIVRKITKDAPTSDSVHVDSPDWKKQPKLNLFEINKAYGDAEQRYTFSPWYVPDVLDAHSEWTDKNEVQQAFWKYLAQDDRDIRLQHNLDIVAGKWVEGATWPFEVTVPVKHPEGDIEYTFPAGTPFLGIVWEPWAWELIKNGDIRGLSIGGTAARQGAELSVDKEYDPTGSVEFTKMIRHEGNAWNLYSHDGSRHLGSFDSEDAALKREAEIKRISHAVAKAMADEGMVSVSDEVSADSILTEPSKSVLADLLKQYLVANVNFKFVSHGYHWNVRGINFASFHEFFEDIYTDADNAIDPIAENIRKLNFNAPFMVCDFCSETFDVLVTQLSDPVVMCQSLYKMNELVMVAISQAFDVASILNEQGIANYLAERLDQHQKWQWQLRVIVGDDFANQFAVDSLQKHLPGQHDQADHGHGKNKPMNVSTPNVTVERSPEAIALAGGLMAKAVKLEPATTIAMQTLATDFGGELKGLENRIKTQDSLARKIDKDAAEVYDGDKQKAAENISDSLRYTMTVPNENYTDAFEAVMARFKEQGYDVRAKNFWQTENNSYRGVNMKITKNNVTTELQFHTSKSLQIKETKLHPLYEKARELNITKAEKYRIWVRMQKIANSIPIPDGYDKLLALGQLMTQGPDL